MPKRRRRTLDNTVATIQQRYGAHALQRGIAPSRRSSIPHIATGFAALDAATGCGGLPLGAISLFNGRTTSGKLTVAYKTVAAAQTGGSAVAILDLAGHSDPDYLARCGVDLSNLLMVRPDASVDFGALTVDLVKDGRVRALLVDSLIELAVNQRGWRAFVAAQRALIHHLRSSQCALIYIDEPSPPWRRWLNLDRTAPVRRHAALQLDFHHEHWLRNDGELTGYRAQVRVQKSPQRRDRPTAPVEIHFNGAVRARETW